MLGKSALLLGVAAACLSFAVQANAADVATGELDEVIVVGVGETRSVSVMTPRELEVLPPGTSAQKALNFLPGVMAHSIDALGVNEQSMSLQVRGFNTTHLGYTLDGIPLGDGAYNNYNGLSISRALISENLGRAELATGIAGLAIPSTSNLGGALIYTSRDPAKSFGVDVSQSVGSENALRTFARIDTGEHNGFSAYVSGHYLKHELFVDQDAYNKSTGKQLNAKAMYRGDRFSLTGFVDVSRTSQPSDTYMSKDMLARLGPDWGGSAPNWDAYLGAAYCQVTAPTAPTRCVPTAAPARNSEANFTNGHILRNDELYYIAGDYAVTDNLKIAAKVYKHENKGAGNNFIVGWSTQGTTSTADDVPVQIRDTRYTIDREGVLGSVSWKFGAHHIQAGGWTEVNTSSAARYIRTDVKGPFSLAKYLTGQPALAQWVQETDWTTRQFYIEDTITLLDDRLSIDFGFKSTYSKSAATAIRGIAAGAPPASSQFASGTLVAKDNFLPEAGVRWTIAPGHEVFASYAENMAMYQGGFKLGPQSVSQAVWDAQGAHLKPETSKSFDGGYRYVGDGVQVSLSAYHTKFQNRLLQYNPCPTNQQQNPGCGNSFHNAGGITSKGVELGVLWQPLDQVTWYNSASYNKSTYDENLNWCTGATCVIKLTKGKQQVDTPKEMLASVVTFKQGGFSATLSGKYTGRRFYTYTNDQGFGGYTTFDLGMAYKFEQASFMKGAKLSVNVTNLTNKRYISNFDNSVFAPDDAPGSILVFHTSAPRQVFGTLSVSF